MRREQFEEADFEKTLLLMLRLNSQKETLIQKWKLLNERLRDLESITRRIMIRDEIVVQEGEKSFLIEFNRPNNETVRITEIQVMKIRKIGMLHGLASDI